MSESGVGVGRVLSVAAVVGGLSAILWQVRTTQGHTVPGPPLLAGVLLVLLAVFVLSLAWPVRRYLKGSATRPLDPIRAARAVLFAQAGALTGGAVLGWYAAALVFVLKDLDLVAYQARAWQLSLFVLASAGLASAGLLAQSWCRIDPPADDGPSE